MGLTQTWQQTGLWSALKKRVKAKNVVAEELTRCLHSIMPDVEAVLAKGGTAPADFTLHDAEHGYRVAEWMTKLLGAKQLSALSSTELALLLLSAYLHDIGMTPAAETVRRHRQYLLFGTIGLLSESENEDLQRWLDDYADAVVPPLLKDENDSDALDRTDLLLTHYSRFRHNDWSEAWIKANLVSPDKHLYQGFIGDLVRLCRSHHVGYDALIQDDLRPIYVQVAGSQELVHQRYLAAILRVADILDFDPERTPEVVFRHRAVSPGSTIYWYKDHEAVVVHGRGVLRFQGRPRTAVMMHALRTMADDIDTELDLCWRLEKENRFSLQPLSNEPSERSWAYEPQLKRDLRPFEGTFEEFEGRFRPNTRRLLDLLSGTKLYSDNLAAVRELVQNAFDAVRQRLAFQRLALLDAGRADGEAALAAMHSIDIVMHQEGTRWKLTCTDTGIGMTKEILRRRFLATGSRPGHLEAALERRCQMQGFSSGRTGQFGIGAVSYFMLADLLRIDTRRSQDANDAEPNGWTFETRGVDDVAELRKDVWSSPGTTVTFMLRRGIVQSSPRDWFEHLAGYLRATILKTPCIFTLRFEQEPLAISWTRGWTQTEEDLRAEIIAGLAAYDERDVEGLERLSSSRQKEIKNEIGAHRSSIDRLRRDLDARLRILTEEGRLPNNVGSFRLRLPYFELESGVCTAYMQERKQDHRTFLQLVRNDFPYLSPSRRRMMGWYGVRIETEAPFEVSTKYGESAAPFLDIDWESAHVAELTVNRDSLTLSKASHEAIAYVLERQSAIKNAFLKEGSASAFASFNSLFLNSPLPLGSLRQWTYWDEEQKAFELRPVVYPLIDVQQFGRDLTNALLWDGEPLHVLRPFASRNVSMYNNRGEFQWWAPHERPTHITTFSYASTSELTPVAIWAAEGNAERMAYFPDTWHNVAAVLLSGAYGNVWNREHPVVKGVNNSALQWASAVLPWGKLDPLPYAAEILEDSARACAWLLKSIESWSEEPASQWEAIAERNPDLMKRIWRTVFGDDSSTLVVVSMSYEETLKLISRTQWREIEMSNSNRALIEQFLLEPSSPIDIVDKPSAENSTK